MKVNCSYSDVAKGTAALVATLSSIHQANPDAKVRIESELIGDRHNITVHWTEER